MGIAFFVLAFLVIAAILWLIFMRLDTDPILAHVTNQLNKVDKLHTKIISNAWARHSLIESVSHMLVVGGVVAGDHVFTGLGVVGLFLGAAIYDALMEV